MKDGEATKRAETSVPGLAEVRVDAGTRIRGLGASAVLHGLLAAALWWMPAGEWGQPERKPKVKELVSPRAKLVWYPLTRRLPEISPIQIKPAPRATGAIKSGGKIRMALPTVPEPGTQYVRQPTEKRLTQEIPAPNLVAVAAERKPAPKRFEGLPAKAPESAPAVLELRNAPVAVPVEGLPQEARLFGQTARPVKRFEGVPGTQGRPAAELSDLAVEGAPAVAATGLGQSSADAVILGLHPGPLLGPIPEGSRPAQIAVAPHLGEPGAGPGATGGLRLPDIAIKEKEGGNGAEGAVASRAKVNGRPVLSGNSESGSGPAAMGVYVVPRTGELERALSVPLRPSSRTIPLALEGLFRGRLVYTLVVPRPELPQYSGDWIVWFAETQPDTGMAPAMRAPLPAKKTDTTINLKDPPPPTAEGRVQLQAVIRRDGRVINVSVLRCPDARLRESAPKDLTKWEFTPASRNGQALDVNVVIEIPFRL